MILHEFVRERVSEHYKVDNANCATTILKILSEVCEVTLSKDVIHAATGMNGGGKYGAQCGLVEGTLMFLGIFGAKSNIPKEAIVDSCRKFSEIFERRFGSLLCTILRPAGFRDDNAPHLCEPLTCDAAVLSSGYLLALKNGLR